jgi:small GTP-binding protein
LLITYAKGEFPEDYVPTVFENYTTHKTHRDTDILLQLWDTAGQEEFDRLRPISYPGADVVLLCFSTISQASLDAIQEKWHPEVKHYIPDVPFVLVGTKIDLRAEGAPDPITGDIAPVTKEDAQKLTKKLGMKAYLECSAKTTEGLNDVFERAMDLVLSLRDPSWNKKEGDDDKEASEEEKPKAKAKGKEADKGKGKGKGKDKKGGRCSIL